MLFKKSKTLKPCPFCGNNHLILEKIKVNQGMESCEDWCIFCGCGIRMVLPADGYYGRDYYTEQNVIDRWNSRVRFK